MDWSIPPKIKIMEALGSIADGRVQQTEEGAEVTSSDRNRVYVVRFKAPDQIDSDDNGSVFKGYLGYPSICVLMLNGILKFDKRIAESMKDIPWAKWNEENKSYWKTELQVKGVANERGVTAAEIDNMCKEVIDQLSKLLLKKLD